MNGSVVGTHGSFQCNWGAACREPLQQRSRVFGRPDPGLSPESGLFASRSRGKAAR